MNASLTEKQTISLSIMLWGTIDPWVVTYYCLSIGIIDDMESKIQHISKPKYVAESIDSWQNIHCHIYFGSVGNTTSDMSGMENGSGHIIDDWVADDNEFERHMKRRYLQNCCAFSKRSVLNNFLISSYVRLASLSQMSMCSHLRRILEHPREEYCPATQDFAFQQWHQSHYPIFYFAHHLLNNRCGGYRTKRRCQLQDLRGWSSEYLTITIITFSGRCYLNLKIVFYDVAIYQR